MLERAANLESKDKCNSRVWKKSANNRSEKFVKFDNFIQRKASCVCGGGCPSCQAKSADLPISQPTDALEIEADGIAEKVMRMTVSDISPVDDEEEQKVNLSRKENRLFSNSNNQVSAGISSVFNSAGQPLNSESRNFFEPRLGYDFSRVKIHNDSHSNEFAENISAKAFTVGKDIGFAKGEYEPNSAEGRKLLAHELTHIVQQNHAGTNYAKQISRQPKPQKDAPKEKKFTNEKGDCETFPGGETHCEITADEMDLTGKPTTSIDETNACTKPCVIEHEDVHREQHKKFCPKQKSCEKEADQGKRPRSECYEWMNSMQDWECKAYKVSYACMEKRLKNSKSCKSAKNKEYGTRKLASEKCFLEMNCGSTGATGSQDKKKTPEKKSVSDKK